jgi:hypothetical protein
MLARDVLLGSWRFGQFSCQFSPLPLWRTALGKVAARVGPIMRGATARPSIAGGQVGVAAEAEPIHAAVMTPVAVVTRAAVMAIAAAFPGRGGATAGVMAAEDRTAMRALAEDEVAVTEGRVSAVASKISKRLQCAQGPGASNTQDS